MTVRSGVLSWSAALLVLIGNRTGASLTSASADPNHAAVSPSDNPPGAVTHRQSAACTTWAKIDCGFATWSFESIVSRDTIFRSGTRRRTCIWIWKTGC